MGLSVFQIGLNAKLTGVINCENSSQCVGFIADAPQFDDAGDGGQKPFEDSTKEDNCQRLINNAEICSLL